MSKEKIGSEEESAEAETNQLTNFVANNILNSITLNQVVTIVQQVALRDAHQLVTTADDKKLAEIKGAFIAAVEEANAKPPGDAEAADDVEEKE